MGPLVYYLPQLGGDPTGSPPFSTLAQQRRDLALAAYIPDLSAIVPADTVLDKENLPKIKMYTREDFIPEPEFLAV